MDQRQNHEQQAIRQDPEWQAVEGIPAAAEGHTPAAGKAAIEGWLLLYMEFTIVVIALRLLGAYFVMAGDIGYMALDSEYTVYMGAVVIQVLTAAATLLVFILRRRSAPRLAIANETLAIAAAALLAFAFGIAGENWPLTGAQLIVSVCWIVYFLRSARVRRTFARKMDNA